MEPINGFSKNWLHSPCVYIFKVAPGYNISIKISRDQSVSEIISIISDNKTETARFKNKDLTIWNRDFVKVTGGPATFYAISIESISQ